MGEQGWPFANVDKFPAADVDPLYGSEHVKDLYLKADPSYAGRFARFTGFYSEPASYQSHRFTVPVLWDKKNETIVNNESSEIIRIFNTEFNELIPADRAKIDIYPEGLRKEIDSINDWVYNTINSRSFRSFLASKLLTGYLSRWSVQGRFRKQRRRIRGCRLPIVRCLGQSRKDA